MAAPFSWKGGMISGYHNFVAAPCGRRRNDCRGHPGLSGLWQKTVKNRKRKIYLRLLLSATILSTLTFCIEKLIYVNVEQSDEFEKQVEAGVLAFVLNVHNGAVSLADQLRHIGLRPALLLSGLFQSEPEPVKVKPSFILVHSHMIVSY